MLAPAAAHVFVAALEAPQLAADDAHHLIRVLRLRVGEAVTTSDGRGRWRLCRLSAHGSLEAAGPVQTEPEPAPQVTVGFAPVKGDRPEWTVQKLTEVGVDRIVPFVAARSIVRWEGERSRRQVERWRRVAREAAMQSRRAWLPEIGGITSFATLAAGPGTVLAAPGGRPPDLGSPTVLVGPEGGWAPEELDAGLEQVGLGPMVLRAETAAVVAGYVLVALRAGTVRASPHTEPDSRSR